MPVTIIGELLGVPKEDRAQFRSWVVDLVATFEMRVDAEDLRQADIANQKIRAYFADLIAEKRRKPDDALLSRLINVEDEGDRLTDDELSAMAQGVGYCGAALGPFLVGIAHDWSGGWGLPAALYAAVCLSAGSFGLLAARNRTVRI